MHLVTYGLKMIMIDQREREMCATYHIAQLYIDTGGRGKDKTISGTSLGLITHYY